MGAVCTAIVDIDPAGPYPVLLAGVRDEFRDRSWLPPGRHWPAHPGLIGGRDLQASGTWLAVDPEAARVATVLNGWGQLAPQARRLSRGDLPLRFAATGSVDDLPLERYDPFHLLCATVGEVFLLSWNGERPARQVLQPGLHMIVNSGLEGADPVDGPGVADMAARIRFFRPQLGAAARPAPAAKVSTTAAWGPWLPLVDGAGLDGHDKRALLVRRQLGGRDWGTTSVSLVALRRESGGAAGVRYDFSADPGDPEAWTPVIDG
ncbi:MAG: NRDE family protein [Catenulispora sp.]